MKSLQKIIKEAESWPYYDFKDGFLYDENNPKTPAFNKKFNSSIEAEKWLEDNNERGTVRYREAGPNLHRTRIQKREVKSLKQLAEDAEESLEATLTILWDKWNLQKRFDTLFKSRTKTLSPSQVKDLARKCELNYKDLPEDIKNNLLSFLAKNMGVIKEDAQNYSDADSGSGIIMDLNKSEMNEFEKASTEYTFTATDGSKIELEVDPKDYHILAQSSSPGLANKAWNELKIGRLSGDVSSFRKLTDTLLKLGFKVNKKSSKHKEFDPLPDEDKWRNH